MVPNMRIHALFNYGFWVLNMNINGGRKYEIPIIFSSYLNPSKSPLNHEITISSPFNHHKIPSTPMVYPSQGITSSTVPARRMPRPSPPTASAESWRAATRGRPLEGAVAWLSVSIGKWMINYRIYGNLR